MGMWGGQRGACRYTPGAPISAIARPVCVFILTLLYVYGYPHGGVCMVTVNHEAGGARQPGDGGGGAGLDGRKRRCPCLSAIGDARVAMPC